MAFAPLTPKMKILFPLIGSVAAVLLFLLLVWPTGSGGKKIHSQNARQGHGQNHGSEDSRGAGWQPDRPDKKGERNASATGNKRPIENPRETGKAASGEAEGDTWWYRDGSSNKGKAAKSDWWYKD